MYKKIVAVNAAIYIKDTFGLNWKFFSGGSYKVLRGFKLLWKYEESDGALRCDMKLYRLNVHGNKTCEAPVTGKPT
jgi:hypothetical protein